MDKSRVGDFAARYGQLDDEELASMSSRRDTLVPEAIAALDQIIDSRKIDVAAATARLADEQVQAQMRARPGRAVYLLHGFALALSVPLVGASGFSGAIPVFLVGAFAWWLSTLAAKAVYQLKLPGLRQVAAFWGLATLYVVVYLLLYSLIIPTGR